MKPPANNRRGRPRKLRFEVDEIKDIVDKRETKPRRGTADIILSILERERLRWADGVELTTQQQVDRVLAEHFPTRTLHTAETTDAIRLWLSDPTRSAMPTERRWATRKRRTRLPLSPETSTTSDT